MSIEHPDRVGTVTEITPGALFIELMDAPTMGDKSAHYDAQFAVAFQRYGIPPIKQNKQDLGLFALAFTQGDFLNELFTEGDDWRLVVEQLGRALTRYIQLSKTSTKIGAVMGNALRGL